MTKAYYFRSLGSLLLGSGVQLIANVGGAVITTALLPVDQRGLMVVSLTVAALISTAGGLGVGNAIRAILPRATASLRREVLGSLIVVAGILVTGSVVLTGLAIVFFAPLTDPRLGSGLFPIATALLAGQAILNALVTELRFADGRFISAARWSAFVAIAMLIGQLLAVAITRSAEMVVLIQALLALAAVCISSFVEWRTIGRVTVRGYRKSISKILICRGIQTLALPLGIVLLTRADRLVLAAFEGASPVAIYALAATVAEVIRLVPTAVGQLIAREVAVGGRARAVRLRLIMAVAATALGGAIVASVASPLIPVVFGEAYRDALAIIWLLVAAEAFYALLVISNLGLIGGNWPVQARAVAVAAVPLGVLSYVLGTLLFGLNGLAISKIVVYCAAGLVAAWLLITRIRSRDSV